jgi:sugar/nucleoside kinase (ribokinase family)
VLMITAGSRGAYLQTGDIDNWKAAAKLKLKSGNWSRRRLWASAMPVDLRRQINATGAGDCAVAGLLAGLLEGMRIEEAAGCAMLAGRDNLYGLDALSGLPDWPGIIAELEAVKGIFVFETEKDFGKEEY